MSDPRKIYWDSSCFICFLNRSAVEDARRAICDDVLRHARTNEVTIYTSTWTIVEVIRPKMHGSAPLPAWAHAAIAAIQKTHPKAQEELETLWRRYQSNDPAQKLTPDQIAKIQGMFKWPYVKKIRLDQPVADKAVELSRDYGLKPADAAHAASAIVHRIPVLQRWDRDFNKVAHLLTVEDPARMSPPNLFDVQPPVGPTPADFIAKQPPVTINTSSVPPSGNGAMSPSAPAPIPAPIPVAVKTSSDGNGKDETEQAPNTKTEGASTIEPKPVEVKPEIKLEVKLVETAPTQTDSSGPNADSKTAEVKKEV